MFNLWKREKCILMDEVEYIPKLPFHFGCRCMYVTYFKQSRN